MHFLYNLGIRFYSIFIFIASFFNPKAKEWIDGRTDFFNKLPELKSDNIYWFHCASLGEFDQALPVINLLKEKDSTIFIFVTFFSPSGYLHYHKRKHKADYVCYLPSDTPKNARKFIAYFKPKKVFFVKYEFWANYIFEAKKNKAQLFSLSAIFREKQHFFKPHGGFFRNILNQFDFFYVQDNHSKNLLLTIGIDQSIISGDTRYDRVIENKNQLEPNDIIDEFLKGEKAFIIGSSWPEDEQIIFPLINTNQINQKIIIAPHDISEKHIDAISNELTVKHIRFTTLLKGTQLSDEKVIIIDTIGHLSNAYNYGNIAYVGGGFSGSLHNILEPTVFGLPVIFGPKFSKFPEAQAFIDFGNGFSIHDSNSFLNAYLGIFQNYSAIQEKTFEIIQLNKGASLKVINHLQEKFFI
jgi:3-deoxy-D-manno-octulosonic-acid transferase